MVIVTFVLYTGDESVIKAPGVTYEIVLLYTLAFYLSLQIPSSARRLLLHTLICFRIILLLGDSLRISRADCWEEDAWVGYGHQNGGNRDHATGGQRRVS